ncbi:hypothetical protein RRG08_044760 [Elysia crispata]|uniref:Uncharacterized protein n=1 Tax=Elysia crispata TaxID=231223 RepID=A0AAE0ZHR0_9GAST|nr:hypothetical protein RRG08_044760 [Elysia crispata]
MSKIFLSSISEKPHDLRCHGGALRNHNLFNPTRNFGSHVRSDQFVCEIARDYGTDGNASMAGWNRHRVFWQTTLVSVSWKCLKTEGGWSLNSILYNADRVKPILGYLDGLDKAAQRSNVVHTTAQRLTRNNFILQQCTLPMYHSTRFPILLHDLIISLQPEANWCMMGRNSNQSIYNSLCRLERAERRGRGQGAGESSTPMPLNPGDGLLIFASLEQN